MPYVAGIAFIMEESGSLVLNGKFGTILLKENKSVMKALFCDEAGQQNEV